MTTIYNPYNPNQWELNNIPVPTKLEHEIVLEYLESKKLVLSSFERF
jgi:hypothetical protein